MISAVNRIPVTLTAAGERALRGGHPWLFDGAVAKVKKSGRAGDLAIVFSHKKNKVIGLGLYDPDAPIRIRVLHQGGGIPVDENFFRQRIAAAHARREPLLQTDTDGYRLLHGENDGLPGLVTDVYAKVAVVKIYSAVWFPWLALLTPLIAEAAGATAVVLRLARNVAVAAADHSYAPGQILAGELADPEVIFREHGVRFLANVVAGHKTGFFLDHRANRRRVGELARGRDVLDVFSYAGGFSVHALAGGARSVVSLDVSAPALALARRNAALNVPDAANRHETLAADAFAALAELAAAGRTFGLVIVDPPSFAKREREVAGALAAYRRLTALAVPLVAPGGTLLAASCSARVTAGAFFGVVEQTLNASGRAWTLRDKTFHDVDHPVGFPEGAYLKAGYYGMG